MSWNYVPTIVHVITGGLNDGRVVSYLAGAGPDSGFYCFEFDDGTSSQYVIAEQLSPVFVLDDAVYEPANFAYYGHPTWHGVNGYIFYSPSLGELILKSQMTEPFMRDTFQQEGISFTTQWTEPFWKLGPPQALEFGSEVFAEALGPDSDVRRDLSGRFDLPRYVKRGSFNGSGPAGVYYSPDTGKYKAVGSPRFSVAKGPDEFLGETFLRDFPRGGDGRATYSGTKGHAIRFDQSRDAWCIGTPSDAEGAVWWECATAPVAEISHLPSAYRRTFTSCVVEEGAIRERTLKAVFLEIVGWSLEKFETDALVGEVETWR